jgi:protein SCO1/2
MLSFVLVLAFGPLDKDGPPGSRLAVIRPAAEFALLSQDGKPLRLADLRGKVLLVSFIFTTCSGSCPATTHRMAETRQALKDRGLGEDDRVHFLSITLDPARDTPEKLRSYMQLYGIDAARWTFVTGPAADVDQTVAAWGMWARPAADGQLDHPSRVFLVDSLGRVREIYNLAYLKPAWVAEDIDLLLKEAAQVR